jgi:hypothetical protein
MESSLPALCKPRLALRGDRPKRIHCGGVWTVAFGVTHDLSRDFDAPPCKEAINEQHRLELGLLGTLKWHAAVIPCKLHHHYW